MSESSELTSPRITEAIGYDVEVSEPNGPAVRGYITARWADERQPDFDRWLAAHDAEVKAAAWGEGLRAAVENGYRARNGLIPNPYANEGANRG